MAADVGKVYPTDVHLLKKELEALGELFDRERFERKEEIDLLHLEIETLKRLLAEKDAEFSRRFEELYAKEQRTWNPEFKRDARRRTS